MKYLIFKLFSLMCILSIFGCHKNNNIVIEYKGEVIRGITDCTVESGYPYIIKYTNSNNTEDSLITASLPSSFHIIGTKILFKINETIPTNEAMVCTGLFIHPIQKSIYDVKSQ